MLKVIPRPDRLDHDDSQPQVEQSRQLPHVQVEVTVLVDQDLQPGDAAQAAHLGVESFDRTIWTNRKAVMWFFLTATAEGWP